jgi:hypothetical protein
MNNKILPTLAIAAILFSNTTNAQGSNRAFAITGETRGSFNWNVVREIDLSTGEVVKTYYDQSLLPKFEIVNTQNTKLLSETENKVRRTSLPIMSAAFSTTQTGKGKAPVARTIMPMGQGVAAAAFDAKHNRLYYTTMRGTDLRYFDLNSSTGKVIFNQTQPLFEGNRFDEANVITRMAFASDGYGYAITNDGNNLIRFTTDQKPVISNLGQLVDGKNNGTISVHNQCSSWGGDMVGDAYGNLYMITMRNHLFKINTQTRLADYIGAVKGLPGEFTSNGLVVNNDGELVISSAAISDSYYKVNISTLEATKIKNAGDKVYNSSDLANGNLLYQKSRTIPNLPFAELLGNQNVSIYPNPVAHKFFNVQFDRVTPGRYNLVLTDAAGRSILAKTLNINAKGQMERVNLPRTSASGMYLIKLTGADRQVVYSNKIIVE